MEPNNIQPQGNAPKGPDDTEKKAVDDLRSEGVDIVPESSGSVDNEFSDASAEPEPPLTRETPLEDASPAPARPAPAEEKPVPADEMIIYRATPKPEPRPEFPKTEAPRPEPKPQQPEPAPRPVAPKPEPIRPPVPAEERKQPLKNDPSIKPLRTFKSDAEEAVRYQNISTADIALAEHKKKEANPIEYVEEKRVSPGLFIVEVLAVIALIAGGWYYWYSQSGKDAETGLPEARVSTIVPHAKISSIDVSGEPDPLALIAAKLGASNAGLGGVYAVVPTEGATTTAYAPIASVFGGTRMPSRLYRSLAPEYMIGLYTYDTDSPFVIFKDTFFQNAFSGMLEWESDLRNDLIGLVQVSHPGEERVTTDADRFEDMVISNVDARVLRSAAGETILAYAFADKDTIVITTGEGALKFLLDRLLSVRTIQ